MLFLERRMIVFKEILKMDKLISKVKYFSEWDVPPEVILETQDAELFYNSNI
jgi:hypothetical protein